MDPLHFPAAQRALENGEFALALQHALKFASETSDSYTAHMLLGEIHRRMGNMAKAAVHYEQAIDVAPHEAEPYYWRGTVCEANEEFLPALQYYRTALQLDPTDHQCRGHVGRMLYQKGLNDNNLNYTTEGLALMEQAHAAGAHDPVLRDLLAYASLIDATAPWRPHPERPDVAVATEAAHLEHARTRLASARMLYDPANIAIGQRINELETMVREAERRSFAGYFYLRKVPFIVGGIVLLFGQVFVGGALLCLGVLYHFSQFQPGYVANRQLFKEYRPPFIIRRLNFVQEFLGGITIWSTSLSNLIFNKILFQFFGSVLMYSMVLSMLPYEIVKGFIKNYRSEIKSIGSSVKTMSARAVAAASAPTAAPEAPRPVAPPDSALPPAPVAVPVVELPPANSPVVDVPASSAHADSQAAPPPAPVPAAPAVAPFFQPATVTAGPSARDLAAAAPAKARASGGGKMLAVGLVVGAALGYGASRLFQPATNESVLTYNAAPPKAPEVPPASTTLGNVSRPGSGSQPSPTRGAGTKPAAADPIPGMVLTQHGSQLNLREEPSETSALVKSIPNRAQVTILRYDDKFVTVNGETSRWCEIEYNGVTGWAFGRYVLRLKK